MSCLGSERHVNEAGHIDSSGGCQCQSARRPVEEVSPLVEHSEVRHLRPCSKSPSGGHYWVCDDPNDQRMSEARCKYCGEQRDLRNHLRAEEVSLLAARKSTGAEQDD
jgi:hypothetical protein